MQLPEFDKEKQYWTCSPQAKFKAQTKSELGFKLPTPSQAQLKPAENQKLSSKLENLIPKAFKVKLSFLSFLSLCSKVKISSDCLNYRRYLISKRFKLSKKFPNFQRITVAPRSWKPFKTRISLWLHILMLLSTSLHSRQGVIDTLNSST